ncbi:RteC domain-containing protein, partial [Olleya sp. AH-315-K02]|nr:RteC domain-containing protein [Olleya sp. AH-315-K02]
DFYKVYSEIKVRKKSRTKFLDELSIGLSSEMNKSDAY